MNHSKSRIVAVAAALLCGLSLAGAQVTKSGSGYLFRIKLTKGQVVRYSVTSILKMAGPNGQPSQMKMSMPLAQTVNSVANGIANVTAKVGPVSLNGNPMTQKPMEMTVKLDNMGKAVGGMSAANPTYTNYPLKPVPIGGSWSSQVPLTAMGPAATNRATATYKFVGLRSVGGKQVADVSVSIVTTGERTATGKGTGFISVADGLPVKMNITVTVNTPGGSPTTAQILLSRS